MTLLGISAQLQLGPPRQELQPWKLVMSPTCCTRFMPR